MRDVASPQPRERKRSLMRGREMPVMDARSDTRDFRTALVGGFIGGMIASFVKWGTEVPMPPRTPRRPIPPVEVLRSVGLDADRMTYQYSDRTLNYGSMAVHQAFSVSFAMLYAVLAEEFPTVSRWYGTEFGLALTLAFHGLILPLGGWAPPIWELPADELASETFGHLAWIWVIEVIRRDVRRRLSTAPSTAASPSADRRSSSSSTGRRR